MPHSLIRITLLAVCACVGAVAHAQTNPAQTRGALLYNTHCIECHTTQIHWREQRQARDWPSLKAQVGAWQARAGLKWSEADVVEVARHLNATVYQFPQPSDKVTLVSPR